jgi:response regulator RpfG family c-di-GMP phosphodiesterase
LIADEVRDVVGAERCSLFLIDEDRKELWTTLAHGVGGREIRVPLDHGIIGRVAATGKSLRVADAYGDPHFDVDVDRSTGFHTRSILAVPLQNADGKTFGVCEALNKRGGDSFDHDDEALVRILSSLAASGLENARLYEALRASYVETLHRLALTAEYRDTQDTAPHLHRVGRYSRLIAQKLGLSEQRVDSVEIASALHDIGKVGIPDAILRKAGRLTPAEFATMKEHSRIGWEILSQSSSPLLRVAAEIAHAHHERWDGGGYPRGLRGESIGLDAQIVSVADVFDALTSARTYKPAWGFEDSVRHIAQEAGKAFNPRVAAAFTAAESDVRAAWSRRETDG